MGIRNEDAVKEGHYFCEQCRPDLHVELLKRLAKRPRDRLPSSNSNSNATSANRKSRSHSPTHQKPQKRRNTMNSRDAAAYDEMMALLVEHSAAEAAAAQSPHSPVNGSVNGQADGDEQVPSPITMKKKRKRGSEDAVSIKRTRSASTTSDRPAIPKAPHEETPAPTPKSISMPAPPVPPPKSSAPRNRRGGGGRSRPSTQAQDAASMDGDEASGVVPGPSNRRSGGGRSRASGSRRNHNSGGDQAARRVNGGSVASTSAPPSSFSRTYSSQQQQQPLLTSWGLPDYLAHLEPTLPTKTPQPLHLRGSGEERGVRVRWPGKRMSVGDMNKRVRALVEWVGREQASASERYRRREALEAALGDATCLGVLSVGGTVDMVVDGAPPSQPLDLPAPPPPLMAEEKSGIAQGRNISADKSTMKMMEELMEELIGFQERYGPGAKSKERRTAVLS
ncbi:hypothetical protein BJV78DRAFT_1261820 [Lactifluus subvellereus]|nr:hypothetical protein BJV78DRAFT_1261820 [Lactifluus subvellereus]